MAITICDGGGGAESGFNPTSSVHCLTAGPCPDPVYSGTRLTFCLHVSVHRGRDCWQRLTPARSWLVYLCCDRDWLVYLYRDVGWLVYLYCDRGWLAYLYCDRGWLAYLYCDRGWLVYLYCDRSWLVYLYCDRSWLVYLYCDRGWLVYLYCDRSWLVYLYRDRGWLVYLYCHRGWLVYLYCHRGCFVYLYYDGLGYTCTAMGQLIYLYRVWYRLCEKHDVDWVPVANLHDMQVSYLWYTCTLYGIGWLHILYLYCVWCRLVTCCVLILFCLYWLLTCSNLVLFMR